MSLQKHETKYVKDTIKRKLTKTELQIVAAEWSEHCSYKSSKKHLKMLPTTGPNVILEKGYDSGVCPHQLGTGVLGAGVGGVLNVNPSWEVQLA